MIETDTKIKFKLNNLKSQSNDKQISIYFHYFIIGIVAILAIVIPIIISKYYSKKDNLYLAVTFSWLIWILSFYFGFFLEEHIEVLRTEKNEIDDSINILTDFSAYLIAYRHIKALENGNNIYPELRQNDSKYILEHDKEKYEAVRLKYEETSIIDLSLVNKSDEESSSK